MPKLLSSRRVQREQRASGGPKHHRSRSREQAAERPAVPRRAILPLLGPRGGVQCHYHFGDGANHRSATTRKNSFSPAANPPANTTCGFRKNGLPFNSLYEN